MAKHQVCLIAKPSASAGNPMLGVVLLSGGEGVQCWCQRSICPPAGRKCPERIHRVQAPPPALCFSVFPVCCGTPYLPALDVICILPAGPSFCISCSGVRNCQAMETFFSGVKFSIKLSFIVSWRKAEVNLQICTVPHLDLKAEWAG